MYRTYFYDPIKGDKIEAIVNRNKIVLFQNRRFKRAIEFPTEEEMHEWLSEKEDFVLDWKEIMTLLA